MNLTQSIGALLSAFLALLDQAITPNDDIYCSFPLQLGLTKLLGDVESLHGVGPLLHQDSRCVVR